MTVSGATSCSDDAAIGALTELCVGEGCAVAAGEPLARHTSMGVGGPTPLMIWPRRPQAVGAVVSWMGRRGLSWRVLGGGTNVLVGERGVAEPVVNLCALTDGLQIDSSRVQLPAGLPTAQALRVVARHGLAGLQWATGLPGTIGGATAGNAGCWGGEMADVVRRIDAIGPDGEWRRLADDELGWSYRNLDLEEVVGRGTTIVAVMVDLEPGDPEELEERSRELQRIKRQRQPVGARNAGCIFKNPDAGRSAGQLVDSAGCKGMRVGDAEVSPLHGNFIVNHGDASADDVLALIDRVREQVRRRHGVTLEEEIRRW